MSSKQDLLNIVFVTLVLSQIKRKITNYKDHNVVLSAIHFWCQENIKYVSDLELYGQKQVTVDVATTLDERAADCEDFAWLAYNLALLLGVPEKDLKLFECTHIEIGSHCVLIHQPTQKVYDTFSKFKVVTVSERVDLSKYRELDPKSFPNIGEFNKPLKLKKNT